MVRHNLLEIEVQTMAGMCNGWMKVINAGQCHGQIHLQYIKCDEICNIRLEIHSQVVHIVYFGVVNNHASISQKS